MTVFLEGGCPYCGDDVCGTDCNGLWEDGTPVTCACGFRGWVACDRETIDLAWDDDDLENIAVCARLEREACG